MDSRKIQGSATREARHHGYVVVLGLEQHFVALALAAAAIKMVWLRLTCQSTLLHIVFALELVFVASVPELNNPHLVCPVVVPSPHHQWWVLCTLVFTLMLVLPSILGLEMDRPVIVARHLPLSWDIHRQSSAHPSGDGQSRSNALLEQALAVLTLSSCPSSSSSVGIIVRVSSWHESTIVSFLLAVHG